MNRRTALKALGALFVAPKLLLEAISKIGAKAGKNNPIFTGGWGMSSGQVFFEEREKDLAFYEGDSWEKSDYSNGRRKPQRVINKLRSKALHKLSVQRMILD